MNLEDKQFLEKNRKEFFEAVTRFDTHMINLTKTLQDLEKGLR